MPDVAKIDFIGVQEEKIYLEFSTQQLSALGLDPNALVQTLQTQNAMASRAASSTPAPRRSPSACPAPSSASRASRTINFRANGRYFRLSDIAKVRRGYVDPPSPMFRYNGQPAIGLAVSMVQNGDALALGQHIKASHGGDDGEPARRH